MRRTIGFGCAVIAAAISLGGPAVATARERWDTRVLALVPRPGFPASAYAAPNGRVYEGTYDNPLGDHMPSRVLEYDAAAGTLLRSWTVQGQNLAAAHGVQVTTSDAAGRLVLLDKSPPRALLLDPKTGEQTTYAAFQAGAVPNYGAWGPDGSLYVTDYEHAVLWKVPPGGGTPVPWLRDGHLDGLSFGTTGLVLGADQRTLYIGQQSAAGLQAGNPTTGRIYTVAIQPDGSAGPVHLLWESGLLDGPDGFAVAKSGTIYVALLLPNQIAVIGADGHERERFPRQPLSGANGSPVPFDSPSSVHFLGDSLIVACQSYFLGDATHQAIFDVHVGEPGLPELIPGAGQAQSSAAKATPKKHKRHRAKRKRARRG